MSISFNQLANIGVHAPLGATSFHTAGGRAIYLIGSTGQSVEQPLTSDQEERLRRYYNIGGTLGWPITGAGRA